MLIYFFHHPFFHYASWVRPVQVYKRTCFFIFETYPRAGGRTFVMLYISKIAQQGNCLFKSEILWECLKSFYEFLFLAHNQSLCKGTKFSTKNEILS